MKRNAFYESFSLQLNDKCLILMIHFLAILNLEKQSLVQKASTITSLSGGLVIFHMVVFTVFEV